MVKGHLSGCGPGGHSLSPFFLFNMLVQLSMNVLISLFPAIACINKAFITSLIPVDSNAVQQLICFLIKYKAWVSADIDMQSS